TPYPYRDRGLLLSGKDERLFHNPELPNVKGEQEEFCTSPKGEQLVWKPETDTFPVHEEGDHSEPEQNRDQLLSHNSPEPDQEEGAEDNSLRNKSEQIITNLRGQTYEKPHLCSACGKGFGRMTDLKRHMRIHTGEKPHSCSTCGKRFGHMDNLKRHMRIHTGEKPHSCSTCGRRFTRMESLNSHMRIHTGEKPYSCNICWKRFNHITSLKTHMRIHTGEKPFCCSTCGKGLSCVAYLKRHMRVHTGEKPHSCSTCGKKFSRKTHMKIHMRSHTGEKPYSCSTCGKRLSCLTYLRTHMRIHTGEKPYSCSTCGKTFSQMTHLKTHMRIHTGEKIHSGEKPHCCICCRLRYLSAGILLRHHWPLFFCVCVCVRVRTRAYPYSYSCTCMWQMQRGELNSSHKIFFFFYKKVTENKSTSVKSRPLNKDKESSRNQTKQCGESRNPSVCNLHQRPRSIGNPVSSQKHAGRSTAVPGALGKNNRGREHNPVPPRQHRHPEKEPKVPHKPRDSEQTQSPRGTQASSTGAPRHSPSGIEQHCPQDAHRVPLTHRPHHHRGGAPGGHQQS
uniref:C2H2-type domain-containing protein n=1 Tax=Amphilophus citrinellus TaxID=61819 RepID=A0A3Q0SX72_AMPCI